MNLKGDLALVVGANRGIGLEVRSGMYLDCELSVTQNMLVKSLIIVLQI